MLAGHVIKHWPAIARRTSIFALPYLLTCVNYGLMQPHIFCSRPNPSENKAPFGATYYYHEYAHQQRMGFSASGRWGS